jgi:hypothetical protein
VSFCEFCAGPVDVTIHPELLDQIMNSGRCVVVRHATKHYQGCAKGGGQCAACGKSIVESARPLYVESAGGGHARPPVRCSTCYAQLPTQALGAWTRMG